MLKTWMMALMFAATLGVAHADPLVWQTPYGTFQLPFQATEALIGYDAVLKQSIGGASLPVYVSPLNIVALQVGAVAVWPVNSPVIQPYLAIGHDIAREIPLLAQFGSFHLNAFGRYDPGQGKAGAGLSASYSFGS